MICLQWQSSAIITRTTAEKLWERVGGDEADSKLMRTTKENMQHRVLMQPTAESAKVRVNVHRIRYISVGISII